MKFSSMLLYVNDEFPTKQVFEALLTKSSASYRKGQLLYTVEQSFIGDSFYWMYFQYDNENIYTETVIDTVDYEAKSNPRPKNLVEMRHQLFACYDIDRHTLYVSDYTKKGTITDYISDMLQKPSMVKNVIKDIDEFFSAVKRLKSVTFTHKRNLFTETPDSIFKKQANLYGLDLPERSKIKLDYGISPIGMVKSTLQEWGRKRDNGELEEVVVVGIDDSGLENTFNFSTVISTLEIDLKRDENYRYDSSVVQTLLLAKLGG